MTPLKAQFNSLETLWMMFQEIYSTITSMGSNIEAVICVIYLYFYTGLYGKDVISSWSMSFPFAVR